MATLIALLRNLINLWGIFQQPETYDVIVIGAGAGGCPLAETLAEGGLKVALLERGGEQVNSSRQLLTSIQALRDDCAESLRSVDGLTVTTGNCMGGATSVNHGIFVQERPEWVQAITSMNGVNTLSIDEIVAAYDWVRERVAPESTSEPPGSPLALYVKNLVNIYGNHSGFTLANVTAGQYQMEEAGVWRTHSTFNPKTGRRRSSDTLLDRNNTNLKIRTNTKVTAILFDGDGGIPYRVRSRQTGLSRARCVRLASLELICVKPEGRIYLSAGAFHTPALLMRSGIGPNGTRFKNSEVGQNLVDKPALLVAGSFQPGFDESARLDFSHIAATQQGSGGTQLYEELNVGVDAMLSLAAWQRNFVPASIRNTLFADAATELIDFCDNEVDVNPTPSFLCDQVVPIVKGGCHKNIFGVASLIGEPTSRGTISLNSMGQVNVDVNYLTTDHDLRAFGAAVRTGFGIVTAHTGATAPQLPCKDKTDAKCMSTSCPELIADYIDYTRGVLKLLLPKEAYKMKAAPASVIYPQFIEPALANISYDDDLVFGKFIRDDIFAAHHFAGSASIGTVVDSSLSFQVMGVSGLYVVDASMLPTTPRVNPMATVMALGRIAGLRAVAELSES